MINEETRLGRLVVFWRAMAHRQLRLRVAADQRAGKKNVAALEARVAALEARHARNRWDYAAEVRSTCYERCGSDCGCVERDLLEFDKL